MLKLWIGVSLVLGSLVTDAAAEQGGVFDSSAPLDRVDTEFVLADGAAWDGRSTLYVPDVKAKKLFVLNTAKPDQAPRTRLIGIGISGTCYQNGRLYLADNSGARVLTLGSSGAPVVLAKFGPKQRPNDLTVDVAGNVYATFTGEGLVRRIAADGNSEVLVDGLVSPNGIAISPDGNTLVVSSFKTGLLSRTDLRNDNPVAQDFAQLAETDDGFRGDGMAVDRAGNVYCTGADSVTVWSPGGTLIDELVTPHRPINVILAGSDGRSLYISTFGGLYMTRVNAYGVSPNPAIDDTSQLPTSTRIDDAIETRLNRVFAVVGERRLLMDLFIPRTASPTPRPSIVVVHGGGWLKGDKTKFRALAVRLAERGYVTAAIEYRLGYEAKFPAAIMDCNEATAFIRQNADEFGVDPNRIAAVGGSAGGHLVGLMAAGTNDKRLRMKSPLNDVSCVVNAAVVLAGPLQIATGSVAERSVSDPAKSNSFHWMGGTVQEMPALYHLADAYEKLDVTTAPMLFMCGSQDNPDRNQLSRQRLTKLGVPTGLVVHQDATHGHWNRPDWIEQVVEDIDQFLKKQL